MFLQIARARAAITALRAVYGAREEEEMVTRFLADIRLLSSEGHSNISVTECEYRSRRLWVREHPLAE